MKTRTLGHGLEVSSIGLGCMGMSQSFPPIPERGDSVALIRAAVERGVTFFDTARYTGWCTRGLERGRRSWHR